LDISEFLLSINVFDLLVLAFLMAFFILGFIQGTIRRLLGIASVLFSFLLAANLREPLGDYLAQNWRQYHPEYAKMLGMATVFVAAVIVFSLLIQTFYKTVPLFDKYTIVDEILGGLLGIVQAMLLLVAMIVILDSFFAIPGLPVQQNEVGIFRSMYNAYNGSITGDLFRFTIIPVLFAILGPFIPNELRTFFPSGS
jgi:membrane protein required for colicin V production